MGKLSIIFLTICILCNCSTKNKEGDYDIKFGLMRQANNGTNYVYNETTTIPKFIEKTGFKFGYTIRNLRGTDFSTFLIVYPPSSIKEYKYIDEVQKASRVKAGGLVIRTVPITAKEGIASVSFSLNENDPLGIWKLEIYVEGILLHVVTFSVVPPLAEEK